MELRRSRRIAGLTPEIDMKETIIYEKTKFNVDEDMREGNILLPVCGALLGLAFYSYCVFSLSTRYFERLFL